MKKKFLSMVLVTTLALTMLTGCGSKDTKNTTGTDTKQEVTEEKSEEGKVFNIYAWNDEFKTRMVEHYPGYKKVSGTKGQIGDVTVNWIITPSDDNAYQNALDQAMLGQENASADKKVDLFLVEADYALKYVDTPYTLDVINDLGVNEDLLKNQYKYTKDIVTDTNGNLKGVSWQAAPGTMIYRRDVAKKVFGTDDPAKIQEKFKDWESFKKAAKELKAQGYQTTSAANDTYRVFSNNVTSKWVEDGKVNIDKNLMNWVKLSKEMVDNGETAVHDMWSDDWSKGFTKASNVFCYFGPSWFIDFTLGGHDLDGTWAATVGPQSYYWGGTWICGANGTDNKTLVKDIIEKLTCDTDTMKTFVTKDNDFVNNKPAMEEMSKDASVKNKVLGGQNPLPIFCEGADKIDLSNLTGFDEGCNEEFQKAMKNYFKGNATLDEALKLFDKSIKTKYPELKK